MPKLFPRLLHLIGIKLRWFPGRLLQPRFVPVPISKTKREKPLNHKLLSLSAA